MFCGNCGSKTIAGNHFCVACGQAQNPASALESVAAPVLGEPETPANESIAAEAVESAPPVNVTARAGVPVTQPGEKPLYCRHSPSERTMLGVDRQHGSETCLGCKLPYLPGSPNSRLGAVAQTTTRAGVKDNGPGDSQPSQPTSWRPFSGNAIAGFVLSLLWLGGIGSIVAVLLADSAMRDVRQGTRSGRGLAVAALVLGILGILLSVVIFIAITLMGQDLSNQFNHVADCVNSPTAPGCP
jgi:hypothetical protein